jgi:hypothetical protein
VVLDQKILNREDGLVEEKGGQKGTASSHLRRIQNSEPFRHDPGITANGFSVITKTGDGSGFPNGIRGKDIPFQARILRVAEFLGRLRMQFKDSPGWEEHAVRELKKAAGTILDPTVVDALTARS